MYLQITPKFAISDVQEAFSSTFPFLKIEFIKKPENANGSSDNHAASATIRSVQDENLEITGEMKVRELEQALDRWFPFDARIFRRSGNIWLETTMTNDWTLEHQNEHGRDISMSLTQGLANTIRQDSSKIKPQ